MAVMEENIVEYSKILVIFGIMYEQGNRSDW
jgi:hypothetical protein